MNIKTWNPRQWVILCVALLVLVGSFVAYFVYVPKVYEVDSLRKQLQAANVQRQRLTATPTPATTTEEQKRSLALRVPAQVEQARFLQELHGDAKASGTVVKSISFSDPNAEPEKSQPSTKPTVTKPPVTKSAGTATQVPMQTFDGKLSIQGDYQQVRKFLAKFSSMTRLVTFNKWTLKAEQQDITPGVKTVKTSSVGIGNVVTSTGGATGGDSSGTLSADEIRKQLPPDIASDKLLNDLTPIFTQTDFNRYAENIRVTLPTLINQHEKDLANLRIQQGFNRYTAGLLGQTQSESVFDQEIAHLFIPGTHSKIREVLGIQTPQPQPTPLPFVNQPDLSIENNHVFKTVVGLDIDFTLYYAPNALDLLPSQPPIHTYDPTLRSNLVESW